MNSSNISIFVAELVGTFGLLLAATGSIVYDGKLNFELGPIFVAGMHFVGLTILVLSFGKYSMAHFNPAVTLGFVIAGYLESKKIPLYLSAQILGAISGILFVRFAIGNYAKLGLNFPNYELPIAIIFGTEILATVFLMGGILLVINIKRIHLVMVAAVIGAIVALDVFFFGPISGASMNPIRSFAPALILGAWDDLWIYLSASFIGSILPSIIFRKKFRRELS